MEKTKSTPDLAKELEHFKLELTKKELLITDYTDHLKRLQAEFENYCKRVEKERKEVVSSASERLIVKILIIIDDFERALLHADLDEKTRQGFELILKNLHKVLDEESVKKIPSVGEKFDPYKHEAILQVESNVPEDTIIEELQKGYMLNGKVIRYSKVKVSKGEKNAQH